MVLNEAQGKVQWQRAVTNTLDILKKAGATQAEITKAVGHLKFAYRGYYTRRNQKIDAPGTEHEPLKADERILEPAEAIQAVAWMDMMYEDSGLTMEKANEAASIIQRAYKKYQARKRCYDVQKVESSKSMVVGAILDTLRHMVFERVTSRKDIPTEYGTRHEMMITSTKVELTFKEHLRKTRLSAESISQIGEMDEEEEEYEDEGEMEEVAVEEPHAKPQEPEARTETDYMEEQAEEEDEVEAVSEAEVAEHLPTTQESEAKAEEAEEVEADAGEEVEAEPEETKAEEAKEEEAKEEEAKEEEAKEEEAKEEEAKEEEAKEEEAAAEKTEHEEEKTGEETEKPAEEVAEETETAEEEPNVAQETSGTADAPAE
nr:PREDICTED: neurofilament light polypeptide-like isoform X1 [Megachile rotundata]